MQRAEDNLVRAEKPSREPDYVPSYGSAYWFNELIYMSGATGVIVKMGLNEDTGLFHVMTTDGKYGRPFNPDIKAKYEEWVYETFEKHLTGVADE